MLGQPQVIKRSNELETTARRLGLSLAATDTAFVLRQKDDELWKRCSTLDEVEQAIEVYAVRAGLSNESRQLPRPEQQLLS